jgi:hypothetical protein
MAYASKAGRARVSQRKPEAQAVCQRCGIWYNRVDLRFQYDWRGAQLQNLYILVCDRCYDHPQEQLRSITLPADPVPIFYPSVEDFQTAESDYRAISAPTVYDPITGIPIPGTTLRITQDGSNRSLFPFGKPVGEIQSAMMTQLIPVAFGSQLSLLSVISNGTATVTVTCSSAHGLVTDNQISVQGLADNTADGFYSVVVVSATVFTYMTYGDIAANSLLLPYTRMISVKLGLPRGFKTIPKIDGPSLNAAGGAVCIFELDDGTGFYYLENGSGYLQLESCEGVIMTYQFELETNVGSILLEDGTDFLEQEGNH